MNDQPVIRTQGLTRYYGARPAVYELSLEVPRGGVFALLGRNGSGKTTTIRMLLGLLAPTRGGGAILGYDIRALPPEARARIGYLTEEHQLYGWMSVRECGDFQSRFYPTWSEKIFRGIIGHFGLRPTAHVKSLSRGERAGLCLALTLAPEPELLILDDPAIGLDPVARRSLIESMVFLTRRSDRTIFFSSHQLPDVERVADFIAVLDHGALRACCPLETFRNSIRQVRLRFPGPPPPLPKIPGLLQAVRTEGELRITCVHYNGATEAALRGLAPGQMEQVPITLEDAFISYLGDRGEKSFILSETEAQP
jgi:ABC-2 type transport system ATP-binding protein